MIVAVFLTTAVGNVQKSLGRRIENLATTRKAVDRFRQLVEHHPELHVDLTSSLSNLGKAISDIVKQHSSQPQKPLTFLKPRR